MFEGMSIAERVITILGLTTGASITLLMVMWAWETFWRVRAVVKAGRGTLMMWDVAGQPTKEECLRVVEAGGIEYLRSKEDGENSNE